MTTTLTALRAGRLLAAVALLAATASVHAATAEPSALDPELQSKLARERLRQGMRLQQNGGDGPAGRGNDGCGRVDIGNANPNDRSAASRLNERNRTVIVTGPVINAARCR